MFDTSGYLLSGVKVKCVYTRSIPSFYMLQDATTEKNKYRFEIKKIGLYVPVIKVTESLQPMLSELCETAPARYHFTTMDCKMYNIPNDTQVYNVPRLYSGRVPQRILLAFYTQTSVVGKVTENPFFTSSSLKIRSLKLSHNGVVVRELAPLFDKDLYAMCFRSFVEFMQVKDSPFMVASSDYKSGQR